MVVGDDEWVRRPAFVDIVSVLNAAATISGIWGKHGKHLNYWQLTFKRLKYFASPSRVRLTGRPGLGHASSHALHWGANVSARNGREREWNGTCPRFHGWKWRIGYVTTGGRCRKKERIVKGWAILQEKCPVERYDKIPHKKSSLWFDLLL